MKLASDKDSKRIILFKNGRECEMAMLKLSNFFFFRTPCTILRYGYPTLLC